jgi:hypothetical protein
MAKRTVKLLGEPIQDEDDKAAAAITPGMLVNWNGSGDLVPHATAAATVVASTFAMEREEMANDIDTAYAIGDTVKVGFFGPGCRVNALVANAVNVAKGATLESAGNGTLRAVTTGKPVARALEAINNTSGANARLRVQIIG